MALSSHDLFQVLLKQLNLADQNNETTLKRGEIQSLTVLKSKQQWNLQLRFPSLLSVDQYMVLKSQLDRTFADIATIHLTINTEDKTYSEADMIAYWRPACQLSEIDSPLCNQLFEEATPVIKQGKPIFYIEHELTLDKFKQDFFTVINEAYHQLGFPDNFRIEPVVDEQKSQARVNEFKEEKEKQDEALAQRLTEQFHEVQARQQQQQAHVDTPSGPIQIGRDIPTNDPIREMETVVSEEGQVTFEGYIFDVNIRDLRSGRKLLLMSMTDYTSSFRLKKFLNPNEEADAELIKEGMWMRARGRVQEDTFDKDIVMMVQSLQEIKKEPRKDTAPDERKRIELHAHSTMSQMDSVVSPTELVEKAAEFGHAAVALSDHAVLQGYPDAHFAAQKHGIKMIYGLEAYLVDDGVPVAYHPAELNLQEATYVIFDVETTGLSAIYDKIIELAAVKMVDGQIIEEFQEFIDPGHALSETTINLTGITDDMVRGSKSEVEVLEAFKAFTQDTILVAHNASFDMGFLNAAYSNHQLGESTLPVIDTLELSRTLHPNIKTHRLNTLAKRYDVALEQHHRAIYDSQTTARLLWIFLKEARDKFQMETHRSLNDRVGEGDAYKQARPTHATILVKNATGLKNLFKIVSESLTRYYYRVPRVPKSLLDKYREGLLVGSGCGQGEVFEAMMQKGMDEARSVSKYYDYIELLPKEAYIDLIDRELIQDEANLEDILRNLIKLAHNENKYPVAVGNVHYLEPRDAIFRDILLETSKKGARANTRNPQVHFRTTDEMLEAFSFLERELAEEIVIDNTHKIADSIDSISPVRTDLYTPKMEGAEAEIRQMSFDKARELYGDPLPELVQKRLEKELDSIIGNGFSVIYLISQKLVNKSVQDGYLVGSRGSVGSSFVATMTGITEVNPLAPHYRCPNCQYSHFFTEGEVGSGFDLVEKNCPECGTKMDSDGHDIPFETFLGFKGDKVPDIDLNFSGEYQAHAHNYTKELFGEDYVYRAGTITTIADKTAFGFVKGYEGDKQLTYRKPEIDRLAKGLTGVRRSTGQHPGGIIVVPNDMDIYDFTPIQYPADDQEAEWKTTHFDFHSIHDNLLKLDILGHDDPTMIRKLQDLSGIDPQTIPVSDEEVMKIFSGPEVLGVTAEQIFSKTGTLGIPEFGTGFVRGMLEQTHPSTFSELLQISGLSHGTDVWLDNAEELIRKRNIPLSEVIGCRDDIMVYLQHQGLDDDLAFKIMEFVRKGRGLSEEWIAEMKEHGVPQWYIDSCLKIKYMFPKAHAAAYVLMALRVAYFKVHHPLYYYAAYFSVRASDFDLVAMTQGKNSVKAAIKEINDKGYDQTAKDRSLLTVLELANEMIERGFNFEMVNIDESHATDFLVKDEKTLLAPFRAVPSLGSSVAQAIVQAREDSDFLSKEDLSKRGKVSKTVMEYFSVNHVVDHLPDENQLSLFDL